MHEEFKDDFIEVSQSLVDEDINKKDSDLLSKVLSIIRNIGIMAHIDAGKTTLTERFLFHAGKIHRVGDTHKGDTQMDYTPTERKRGITIFAAASTLYIEKIIRGVKKIFQINLIDTPGHIDFTAEVERSLRVLDGAVLLIDAQAGVEPQTETVRRQSSKYGVPMIIFINKMDKTGADFDNSIKSIEKKLSCIPMILQIPIGKEENFSGIIDVLSKKAFFFKKNDILENSEERPIPSEYLEEVKEKYDNLLNIVSQNDNEVFDEFISSGEVSIDTMKASIRRLTVNSKDKVFCPIFCGSAYKNIGTKFLLDGIIDYLPCPLDRKYLAEKRNGEKFELSPLSRKTSALCFKVVYDKFGKINFIRVYSGEIKSNSIIYNVSKGQSEKVGRLVRIHANSREAVESVKAGDIAAIIGMKHTVTGNTLCGKESDDIILESIKFIDPVVSVAIIPSNQNDFEKFNETFSRIQEEDPTISVVVNNETNQLVAYGMGELHLDILKDTMRDKFSLKFESEKTKVSYRERITKSIFDT